jgi:hypothetical protein
MDEAVARLNIEHFRKLLAEERDESKRATLRELLAEEEARLGTILRRAKAATADRRQADAAPNETVRTGSAPTSPASGSDEPPRARRFPT